MTAVNAARKEMTVADPNGEYDSMKELWKRSRAFCSGQKAVKTYDTVLDNTNFSNVLIPFSPSMTQEQYNFYKAEAELPGIVAEFSKMILGGLLRKPPMFTLPGSAPAEATDWIKSTFNQDDTSLISFLDAVIWEEIQTSRAWVYVDYPVVPNAADLTPSEKKFLKPYPIIWQAETVINWRVGKDAFGANVLKRVVVRGREERYSENPEQIHPDFVEVIHIHELDEAGLYQIRKYEVKAPMSSVEVVAGQKKPVDMTPRPILIDTVTNITSNGNRLTIIPAWPLNGQIEASPPMLSTIIDKEAAVYNKMSRRNHLLYGAATYTPIITADMNDADFGTIVDGGLGTWIKLPSGSTASILETPTDALQDMEKAIASAIEEMAKLGLRMLTPESSQSGIALDIRNAAQTARLGSLSNKISATMSQVIAFMLEWRYGVPVAAEEVLFKLSEDFNPTPLGADWLRLATEWYQSSLIPRSTWLQILKQNDMLMADYDDEAGQKEITDAADLLRQQQGTEAYANSIANQSGNRSGAQNAAG